MVKRISILMLIVMLVFFTACDDSSRTSAPWSGEKDTSWYDDNTRAESYTLSSAEQLAGFAELVESNKGEGIFQGVTIYLDKDIDMGNRAWTPIGTGERKSNDVKGFLGIFDGNGHTISNFYIEYSAAKADDNTSIGFFGVIQASAENHAVIRNITFENILVTSTSNTAAVVLGYGEHVDIQNATVRNCAVRSYEGAAAIASRIYNGGSIKGCTNENTSVMAVLTDQNTNKAYNAGGIAGCTSWNSEITKPSAGDHLITVSGNRVILSDPTSTISAYNYPAGGIVGTGRFCNVTDNTVEVVFRDQISVTTADPSLSNTKRWFVGNTAATEPCTFSGNTYIINGEATIPGADDPNPAIDPATT